MKNLVIATFILLLSLKIVNGQGVIYTSDVDRFWVAFERYIENQNHHIFDTFYLEEATPGLKNFIPGRIDGSKNLAYTVAKNYKYYKELRKSTDIISELVPQIDSMLSRAKDLYPSLNVPNVYFVIGALNSGGTSSDEGIIVGLDMYGKIDSVDLSIENDWLRTNIKTINQVPHIVAHELIHFQQKIKVNSLLSASLMEGSADFLGELISGKQINEHVHAFALPREKEIWSLFQKSISKKSTKGWLYSGRKQWPNDVGYFIGYKIAEEYYRKSESKKQAIVEIMEFDDAEEFLKKSGYNGGN